MWLCRGTAIDVVLQLVQVAAGHGPNDVEDFLFVWGRHVDVVKGHLTLIDAGAEEGRALEELLLVRQLSTRACKQVVGDHLLNPEVVDVARIVKGQLFVVRRVVLLGRVALNLGQVQVLNLGVDFVLDGLGLRRLLGDVQWRLVYVDVLALNAAYLVVSVVRVVCDVEVKKRQLLEVVLCFHEDNIRVVVITIQQERIWVIELAVKHGVLIAVLVLVTPEDEDRVRRQIPDILVDFEIRTQVLVQTNVDEHDDHVGLTYGCGEFLVLQRFFDLHSGKIVCAVDCELVHHPREEDIEAVNGLELIFGDQLLVITHDVKGHSLRFHLI